MSLDLLSVAAISIVVTLVIVMILLGRSQAATEIKVRRLARHLALLEANEEAREICREIRDKYPDLCPGLDYTIKEDANGASIDEWNSFNPKPGE